MSEKEMCIKTGGNLKTKNLLEQCSYTAKLAGEDSAVLGTVGLAAEFLTEYAALIQEVTGLEGKQESSKDNVSLATASVYDKLAEAKSWVKRSKLKAKRAFRFNKVAREDFFTVPSIGQSVSNAISALTKLIELNKKYDAELVKYQGGNAFAAEGETILAELQEINAKQERAKVNLPEASQQLYYKQGLLYYKTKDINDMAQEAFYDDPLKSRQYNMSILQRGGAKRKKEEVEV